MRADEIDLPAVRRATPRSTSGESAQSKVRLWFGSWWGLRRLDVTFQRDDHHVLDAMRSNDPPCRAGALPLPAQDVAIFDLDRTLIPGSSLVHLGRELIRRRVITPSVMARHSVTQLLFQRRGVSDARIERLVTDLLQLVEGMEAEPLAEVARHVGVAVAGHTDRTARWLLDRHLSAGDLCVLVSASPAPLVEGVAAALGVPIAVGTRLEAIDGRCTGRIEGTFCYGTGKLIALQEHLGWLDLARAVAYADSASDVPLLQRCGAAVAVNPDAGLRRVASTRSWPVIRCG